jgi:Protein of unknown function (DUF2752)
MAMGQKQLVASGMLFCFVAAARLLRVFDPASSRLFPPCPIHYFTGFYCPGCGSLRAVHQLLQGHLQAAWAMNPLSVLLFPFLAYGLACEAAFFLGRRRRPQFTVPGAWIRALCSVILLFGVARNLPFHPFDLLAPGAMLRF